ncbi:helix-turn-helix domain-containing protein [Pirellulimonas nuda]|uniref:helix-turn-helix domain-containing protein n=1 Tax=Pirellulimonas nuda TaxID=2528009 RepID=UPI0018D3D3BA
MATHQPQSTQSQPGDQEPERGFESVDDCARRAGVSSTAVRRWIRRGQIDFAQPGGPGSRLLIPLDALDGLISRAPAASTSAASPASEHKSTPAGPRPAWRTANKFL